MGGCRFHGGDGTLPQSSHSPDLKPQRPKPVTFSRQIAPGLKPQGSQSRACTGRRTREIPAMIRQAEVAPVVASIRRCQSRLERVELDHAPFM